MLHLPLRELLFWGGIGMMAVSVMLLILCITISLITGKRLKKKLEAEYGKPQK